MPAPVVFVHGLRTSSSMWDPQVRILGDRGWSCVAPDLPGHGDRLGEAFTVEAALATIDEAIAGWGEPVHLVGCSLGGMFALHAAALTDRRLLSVVAAGCTTQPSVRSARAYGRVIGLVDVVGGEGAVRRAMGEDAAAHFLRKGRADLATVDATVVTVGGFDLLDDVARIDAPVTFLNGHLDQFRGEERRFLRAARRGRLVVLPFGTHMVNLTDPGRYTTVLESLLLDAESLS